jgi:hypothetical protein
MLLGALSVIQGMVRSSNPFENNGTDSCPLQLDSNRNPHCCHHNKQQHVQFRGIARVFLLFLLLIVFLVQGGFQYFLYTSVLDRVTAPITVVMGHIASAPVKTFLDQAIHHPFMYFPFFYALKHTVVQGKPLLYAMEQYQKELWPNCTALWTLWVPGQVCLFVNDLQQLCQWNEIACMPLFGSHVSTAAGANHLVPTECAKNVAPRM